MQFYENKEWGAISSTIDDVATAQALYQQLTKLEFKKCEEFIYRGGEAHLYHRESTSGKRFIAVSFDYCCILHLGNFLHPVGIKSFQDVLQFLEEIDATPKERTLMKVANLDEIASSLSDLVNCLDDPNVTIRNFASLKNTIDQLAATLAGIGTTFQRGLPLQLAYAAPTTAQNGAVNGSQTLQPVDHEE